MEIKPGPFGLQFLEWWNGFQPSWRHLPDGTLSQDVPSGEKWGSVRKGGSAGLYTVIIAISWWVAAVNAESGAEDGGLWTAVDDITWVLNQLQPFQTSVKRPHADPSDNTSRKRRYGQVIF